MVVFALFAALAHATDLVSSRAFWHDPSGAADFNTARQQPLTTYQGVLSGGYTRGAHWIRASLKGTDATAVLVRIRPQYLDHITLYDPATTDSEGNSLARTTGDRNLPAEPAVSSPNHIFLIPGSPSPRDIWLRIESSSTHLVQVEMLPQREGLQREYQQLLMQALVLAGYVLTVLWALTDWAGRRDPIMLLFAFKQFVLTAQVLFWTGYARLLLGDLLEPQEISDLTSVLLVLSVLTGGLFELLFLREFKPPRWLQNIAWMLWTPCILALVTVIFIDHQTGLTLNSILLLVLSFVTVALAFTGTAWSAADSHHRPLIERGWLRGFYALVFTSAALSAMTFLGIRKAGEWSITGVLAYGLINGMLVITLLQRRNNRLIRSQRERELQLRDAEAVALSERARREEQTRFLTMLTHELKTPLSVVRMTIGTPASEKLPMINEAKHAIDDMRALIDRCVQADRLEGGDASFQPAQVEFDHLLQQTLRNAPADSFTISGSVPPNQFESDPAIIQMILGNLIDNALKYRAPGTQVAIGIESQYEGIRVQFDNTPGAAGWPDATQVFQKYYRSPGAHRETGSGLGLYLVSKLVELAGCTIRYAPTETLVRFELWIPRSIS